jgi:hypothetical protein
MPELKLGPPKAMPFKLGQYLLHASLDALRSVAEGKGSAENQSPHPGIDRTHMVIEDLQRRQDELQKRIELVRSYL